MIVIGAVAVGLNIFPVKHLQTFVVFSSGCAASAFLMPTIMMCYWRRATAAGTIAAMLAGAAASSALNLTGLVIAIQAGKASEFHAYELLGFEPLVWGLLSSFVVGLLGKPGTTPPDGKVGSQAVRGPGPALTFGRHHNRRLNFAVPFVPFGFVVSSCGGAEPRLEFTRMVAHW